MYSTSWIHIVELLQQTVYTTNTYAILMEI